VAFLEAISPQSILDRVRPVLAAQSRVAIISGAAAVVAVVAVTALWWSRSDYAVLYAGLSGEEGGRAIAELQKLNIPFRIVEGGRVIEVPESEVGRARLQLAARGVAKRDGDEWAILDNQSLGVSPFVEQVHYVRGIEAALSRTVGEVDGVVSAKVTLALPKQTDFLGDSPTPSASVLVRLRPGTVLSAAQVSGIVSLVASSVPGLAREHVTVVDQSGAVLNPDTKGVALQAPQQLELTREINHRYETLITDLLVPVLGRGNFRVSSDADVDFSQSRESLIKYGDTHILSQDETIHAHGEGDAPIGIPGALSNTRPPTPNTTPAPPAQQTPPPATPPAGRAAAPPPPAAPAPAPAEPKPVPADTHKTTNYDIDKSVQFLEHPSWTLRGLNIAVLVNNPTNSQIPAERLQAIDKLVTSAIGAGQNQHVTVVDLPFEAPESAATDISVPWWKQPWMAAVGQNVLLILAGLFALFGGALPLLHRLASAQAAFAIVDRPANQNAAPAMGAGPAGPRVAARSSRGQQDVFSIEAETVQTLVVQDPARTAQVIRGWIAGGRSSA
jgi:flagellar M-ring protein FliF